LVERLVESALPSRTSRTWTQAIRPFSFAASIVPALLGTALATTQGLFNPRLLLLTLLGAVAIQATVNLFRDYCRRRGAHPLSSYESSGALVPGILEPSEVLWAGLVLIALDLATGLALAAIRGTPILVFGIVVVMGAYFYSGKPIAHRPSALETLMIFLLFGPLMVLGAYYVQAASVELVPMLYALPVGCFVAAIPHLNHLRGIPFLRRRGEVMVAPTSVRGQTRVLYGLLGAAYLLVIAGVATEAFVRWSALALLSAPLAWGLARQAAAMGAAQDRAVLDAAAARLHLVFGILLVVGVLLPAS
jgi:1,4-dihydroxy-2-naphthoate polyprenyltransferase